MKTTPGTPFSGANESPGGSTKLVSLLALATGAIAMPQTGQATIVYQSVNQSVGFGGTDSNSVTLALPGTAEFPFWTTSTVHSTNSGLSYSRVRSVRAAGYGAYAMVQVSYSSPYLAARRNQGESWYIGLYSYSSATVARSGFSHNQYSSNAYWSDPGSNFDHAYLAFSFQDDTAGGDRRYGWIDVSLTQGPGAAGPSLMIHGYAYDDTGAEIPIGVVPEPSSVSLLALGALAFGAKGVRNWRSKRDSIRGS